MLRTSVLHVSLPLAAAAGPSAQATSLVGADGVPYVLILGGRGDVRLPFADGFILDVALLAGVQDYAEGYGLLATQLQSARIEAAKAIDGREAAEQAAAEALDDGAAAARDADAAADAAAKARSEARSEAARVEALSAALREAQAALAEQRAALAQATETAARLSDDRAEDARAGQRAIDQAREEAQAKWERSEARLEGARAELEEAKAKLASWEEEENRRHLALRQKAAGADKAIAEAELAKREAELAQQRAAAVSEAMMREHAREIAAAEARTQAAQARADAAAASAAEGGIGAAERARAAAVEITTLRTQLAHALSLEQAAQLRLREAQAARGAEAAELRAGITAAAAEADEARAAFTAARSEAGEALAQLGRELDAAQARVGARARALALSHALACLASWHCAPLLTLYRMPARDRRAARRSQLSPSLLPLTTYTPFRRRTILASPQPRSTKAGNPSSPAGHASVRHWSRVSNSSQPRRRRARWCAARWAAARHTVSFLALAHACTRDRQSAMPTF